MRLFLIALAGALGTLSRYGVYVLANQWNSRWNWAIGGISLGTLIVNVLGSFLLGVVGSIALQKVPSDSLRLVVGIGFLGAFTTFSTFEFESLRLIESKAYPQAALYISLNLLLGLGGLMLGREFGNRLSLL